MPMLRHAILLSRTSWLALGVIGVALGACSLTPKEAIPPLDISMDSFAGTLLTGPINDAPEMGELPWSVDVRIALIDDVPTDLGESLTSIVRHVFVEGSGEPLRTRSALAVGTRVAGEGPSLDEFVWQETFIGALWPGTAVRWHATHVAEFENPGVTRWDELDVVVSRPRDKNLDPVLALSLGGWVNPEADAETSQPGKQRYEREHIVLDSLGILSGQVLRVILPAPRARHRRAAQLIEIRVNTAPDPGRGEFAAFVARERSNLESTLESMRAQELSQGARDEFQIERARALESLNHNALRRPALLFLSDASGAPATGELAMIAEDSSLREFCTDLQEWLEERTDELIVAEEFGWFLESSTIRWLTILANDPGRQLPVEYSSMLVRRMGELGRYPDLVFEVVRTCSNQTDLAQRVLAENLIFLEDAKASARVRAFDWLRLRGEAPADYDPLGSRSERRAALSAVREEGA